MKTWNSTAGWPMSSTARALQYYKVIFATFTLVALSQPTIAEDGESTPSAEMLEFLGGWETDDGEAYDPALWEELWGQVSDKESPQDVKGENHEN